jgi:hypothetical protein
VSQLSYFTKKLDNIYISTLGINEKET